jgi:predicted aspartyl protease
MSLTHRFNQLFVLLAFATFLPAMAQVPQQTVPNPNLVTAKIKLEDLSMIIVPVSINGSGPYDFLLDTGCAKTMVDQKLADELGLPRLSEKTVTGVLASVRMTVVHANSLSVGGATVGGGDMLSAENPATVTCKVRGVLGEDFLKNFDVLIDYRHQVIELEAASGVLAATAGGERLPLQLDGVLQGQPTHNRLVVTGSIPELSEKPMTLLLDSGTNHVTLFQDHLGADTGYTQPMRTGSFGAWTTSVSTTRTFRSLKLGRSSVADLTVVGLARRPYVDIDGLLPTSMFHSIFISHRDRFVILNPSFPKMNR